MAEVFHRDVDTVDRALTIACSRRNMAKKKLTEAQGEVETAERILLHAVAEVELRERHVGMCDRSIDGLIDERLAAVVAEQVVSA